MGNHIQNLFVVQPSPSNLSVRVVIHYSSNWHTEYNIRNPTIMYFDDFLNILWRFWGKNHKSESFFAIEASVWILLGHCHLIKRPKFSLRVILYIQWYLCIWQVLKLAKAIDFPEISLNLWLDYCVLRFFF